MHAKLSLQSTDVIISPPYLNISMSPEFIHINYLMLNLAVTGLYELDIGYF